RGCTELNIRWLATEPKNEFPVSYELHCGQGLIYSGEETQYCLKNLSPATNYAFRLRVCTEVDKSPFSEAIIATTEEAAPSKPQNIRLLASTATQLKVGWDPSASGSVRTYIVYCDGRQVDCTTETTSIISGLSPCTQYSIQVCASSSKGKSERAVLQATTLDLGAHAPPKPQVTVLGRHEMSVTWEIPEQPLGRINHYNVVLNGKKVVYTGTDMTCKVVVVTNEGKAESKATKKRTAKDECEI
uniref:Fibronectin type-III domain-containing protein n=1 Tax=Macrostomum lignano TaxID=282301 RepID=A0A1I8G332_9PLAT